MRRIAIIAVVAVTLVAGCSTGPTGGATPGNETETATFNPDQPQDISLDSEVSGTADGSELPGVEGSTVTNASRLVNVSGLLTGESNLTIELENETRTATIRYQNDSSDNETYFELSQEQGTTAYYLGPETAAAYNSSTGDVIYENGTNDVREGAGFAVVFIAAGFTDRLTLLEWQVTEEHTVGGETYYVLESDSLNQTAVENSFVDLSGNETVRGTMTVDSDGTLQSAQTILETPNGSTDTITYSYSDSDVDVTPPSWYDEDEAQESAS